MALSWPFMLIVPLAWLPEKSTLIAIGPCLTLRFRTSRVPFSRVEVSVIAPIGVSTVSVATHWPPSSAIAVDNFSAICWPPIDSLAS